MFCPLCAGDLAANTDTWTCKKCKRTFEIIEHSFGQTHRYQAGEVSWKPPVMKMGTCPVCDGRGTIPFPCWGQLFNPFSMMVCPRCNGEGRIPT